MKKKDTHIHHATGGSVDGGSEKVHEEVGYIGSARATKNVIVFLFVLSLALSVSPGQKGLSSGLLREHGSPKYEGG